MAFPANYNIQYYQSDKYEFVIRPKTSAGEPFPISNSTHTAHFYISTARGGDASNTKEALASIVGGNIICTITPQLGNTLNPASTYFYDISIENNLNNQEVYTLLTGNISVTADITDPVV